jgi:ketosteroid isomerase-like protein
MKTKLPEPLESYFDAVNREDIDAMVSFFAADAVVRDEGKTRSGHAEVRTWVEEVTQKYRPRFEVEDVVEDGGGEAVVIGLVSGNFPGGPLRLRYAFRLGGGRITHLEIS